MQNNLISPNAVKTAARRREQGFSLLEVVIAMVIFIIVTTAVYGVLQLAQRNRLLVNQQVQSTKNVRFALNLIGRDTYNAGFGYPMNSTVVLPDNKISTLLNIPNDFDTSRDTVPPILAGNNVNANTFNTTAGTMTDQVTFIFKDSTFNLVGAPGSEVSQPLNINAATTNATGIDEIVPISGSNAACRKNDIYLVTGNTGSALALVTALSGTNIVQFSNGDVLGFNQTGTGGTLRGITTPASMQRVRLVTYFVTTDGILTRREYANVPPTGTNPPINWTDEPIVYGVENFQIKYVMDDGSLSDNPSAGPDGVPGTADDLQSNLAKIRQVRFTVNVRTNELDHRNQPYRVNMTSTFSTRNLGYDAS
ncbi:MAG TPA: prepilin-type N-terminal cleavage/methylation domain-containing protein [Pyrinomonadaceae bacterium]|jgi:prepilin-type N-terminal cleavage/methylation domain-containing protein